MEAVVAVCENTGRLDHILSNLNTLQRSPDILGSIPLYLRTRDSLSWVLHPGRHRIHVDDSVTNEHCGLVPLGHPAIVTSSGFKWDMSKLKLIIYVIKHYNIFSGYSAIETGIRRSPKHMQQIHRATNCYD